MAPLGFYTVYLETDYCMKNNSFTRIATNKAEFIASHQYTRPCALCTSSRCCSSFFSILTSRCSTLESLSSVLSNFFMLLLCMASRLKWRTSPKINGMNVGISRLKVFDAICSLPFQFRTYSLRYQRRCRPIRHEWCRPDL